MMSHRYLATNDESVKPYIATDIEHLKMCSAAFRRHRPERRWHGMNDEFVSAFSGRIGAFLDYRTARGL